MQYSNEKNVLLMVALLKAHGIRKVVASPGTTNITFVASLTHDPFFQVYSSVDERSAAYMACGMADESGEPVVISCTGATASRNYFPGLTEAYYRKLPILAITSTREECKIGHLIDQQIDRTCQPKDTVICSEHLQIIKDDEDWWNCTIKANRAILALRHNGGGPAHINLPTLYSPSFDIHILPEVRKITRIYSYDVFPELKNRDIAIFVGTHRKMTIEEQNLIDRFCENYNAVVFCDTCSGYHGKYALRLYGKSDELKTDILIHLGEVSCVAYYCKPNEVWRVCEDGELRDTYRKLRYVFSMPLNVFFNHYTTAVHNGIPAKFNTYKKKEDVFFSQSNDVPFSNGWIANYLHDKMPDGCAIHLGIVSTFFAWNRLRNNPSIDFSCNQGGFGIDGNISTLLGQSLVNPNRLYFCCLGDLAFFYDMNVLGNRHFGNNVRILLINNGRGVIFRKPGNMGSIFGDGADEYISAARHYGNMSPTLVRDYAMNLGFQYLCAKTKEEFIENAHIFINPQMLEKPILFEAFTEVNDEIQGDNIHSSMDFKNKIRSLLGDNIYDSLRTIIKGDTKGKMGVDIGSNKKH